MSTTERAPTIHTIPASHLSPARPRPRLVRAVAVGEEHGAMRKLLTRFTHRVSKGWMLYLELFQLYDIGWMLYLELFQFYDLLKPTNYTLF